MLWLSLSRRPSVLAIYEPHATNPTALRHYIDLIELSVLVGRYDRSAAEVVFAPVAARVSRLEDEQWGHGEESSALFRAAGSYDARAAMRLLDTMAEDPPLQPGSASNIFRHKKDHARVALARTLGLAPGLRLREPFLPGGSNGLGVLED